MLKAFTDKRLQTFKATEKKQRIADPGTTGLYFVIEPLKSGQTLTANCSKSFIYRYTFDGVNKQITLGKYPALGLAEARRKTLEMQKLIIDGFDPKQLRDTAKEERQQAVSVQQAASEAVTFKQAYEEYCRFKTTSPATNQKPAWTYETLKKHNNRVYNYVMPVLGERPLAGITTKDLQEVLLAVQAHGTLANRDKLKTLFGGLFDYCYHSYTDPLTQSPLLTHNIALHISKALFPPKQVTHYAHVTETDQLSTIVKQIDAMAVTYEVRQALRLQTMLFLRPVNITSMEWAQVDLEKAVVTYTAEQMKMRKPFKTTLPKQAVALLRELQAVTGHSRYVFLSPYGGAGKPIGRDALSNALRSNGVALATHGFRHTASTILHSMKFMHEAIEAQLSHTTKGVAGTYNQSDYLEERRIILQAWADLIDGFRNDTGT